MANVASSKIRNPEDASLERRHLIHYSRVMDKLAAIQLMSALAQPTRMEVFFALRDRVEGLSVGELAKLVDTPSNTMSSHLAILARAGAVIAARSGRVVTYSADPTAVSELTSFLSGGDQRR